MKKKNFYIYISIYKRFFNLYLIIYHPSSSSRCFTTIFFSISYWVIKYDKAGFVSPLSLLKKNSLQPKIMDKASILGDGSACSTQFQKNWPFFNIIISSFLIQRISNFNSICRNNSTFCFKVSVIEKAIYWRKKGFKKIRFLVVWTHAVKIWDHFDKNWSSYYQIIFLKHPVHLKWFFFKCLVCVYKLLCLPFLIYILLCCQNNCFFLPSSTWF